MAYKDEYEVARLCLEPTTSDKIRAEYGPNAKIYWNIHPPILRNHGLAPSKLRLGRWFRPVFALLYRMRWLRGTRLDVFGYSDLRKLERRVRDQYLDVIETVVADLSERNFGLAMKIAELPEAVRGYEQLKTRRLEEYRVRLTDLLGEFRGDDHA
jgi:indolepyruvate ferredoxin oxidoreductase